MIQSTVLGRDADNSAMVGLPPVFLNLRPAAPAADIFTTPAREPSVKPPPKLTAPLPVAAPPTVAAPVARRSFWQNLEFIITTTITALFAGGGSGLAVAGIAAGMFSAPFLPVFAVAGGIAALAYGSVAVATRK